MIEAERNREVVIVASGGLGDALLVSPFVRHFAARYERVVCATTGAAKSLFENSPYVDELVPCPPNTLFLWGLPERGRDVFSPYVAVSGTQKEDGRLELDARPIHNLNLGDKPAVEQVAEHFGIELADSHIEIHCSERDEAWAESVARQWGEEPALLVHCASRFADKLYPLERWSEVVRELRGEFHVISLPVEGASELGVDRVLEEMPTPARSAALFRKLAGVVTIDSFPGHLAAAVGTPAVVLFGPSNPAVFGHSTNRNLTSDVCPHCADTQRQLDCRRAVCLEAIDPARVVEAVRESCTRPKERIKA